MSGDRKSSKAWQFFTDLNNNKAKCNFCQKEFSYKGGGAYNLIRHTKSKHPHVFVAIRECPLLESTASATEIQHPSTTTVSIARELNTLTASTSTASAACMPEKPDSLPATTAIFKAPATNTKLTQYFCKPLSAKKTDQLNKMLVKVFTKNYLAFHLVESPEFKDFMKELNPAYQLPSRKTLSNALLTNVILISNALKKNCVKFLSSSHPDCVLRMAQVLLNEISTRFSGIEDNNIFAESTILDPRFKKYGFENKYACDRACSNLKAMAGRIELN
ncbi:hypothetical protein HW555_004660, partial [Spodoptera exigua]